MKKKITMLFDANPLLGKKSGVGHFSERLLVNYADKHKEDIAITAYYFNFFGRKDTSSLPRRRNIKYKEVRFLPTKLLSLLNKLGVQIPLELFIGFSKYDFSVFPNFISVPSIRKTPYFLAVHDLTFIDCPEYMQYGNQKYLSRFVPSSIKHAKGIITISEFTKKRLLQNYNLSDDNILVLPIPYEPENQSGSISSRVHSLSQKKFILFVGTIEPRKNIENLVKGFGALPKKIHNEYTLVLAGSMGWKTTGIIETINHVSKYADIVVTGYITDAERDLLYSKCRTVCLVSHYEGFGMPILEAAYHKKGVVLSPLEVFKEIAGKNAYYCRSKDPSDIAAAIKQSIEVPIPKIIKTTYSWRKNISNLDDFIVKNTGVGAGK